MLMCHVNSRINNGCVFSLCGLQTSTQFASLFIAEYTCASMSQNFIALIAGVSVHMCQHGTELHCYSVLGGKLGSSCA